MEVRHDDAYSEVLEVLVALHYVIERVARQRGRPPLTPYLRGPEGIRHLADQSI
jgi:hypothetical protein